MADAEQTQKMVPLITCETSLCYYVCELVFSVNIFDLDFGVQNDSIKQPMKSNSVGSGNMSHCRTSHLCDHLDHCFVVSNTHNKASSREEFAFEETKSTLFTWSIFPGIFFRVGDVDRSPRACLL